MPYHWSGIQWQVPVLCFAKVWACVERSGNERSRFYIVCHTPFTDADKIPINGNEELLALWERMEADKARIREKKQKSAKTAKTNLAEVIGAGSPILSGAQVEWIVRHQQCCYWCEANK